LRSSIDLAHGLHNSHDRNTMSNLATIRITEHCHPSKVLRTYIKIHTHAYLQKTTGVESRVTGRQPISTKLCLMIKDVTKFLAP